MNLHHLITFITFIYIYIYIFLSFSPLHLSISLSFPLPPSFSLPQHPSLLPATGWENREPDGGCDQGTIRWKARLGSDDA